MPRFSSLRKLAGRESGSEAGATPACSAIVPLTAGREDGVAAVFQHLRNRIAFEIEAPDMGAAWRQTIVTARKEMEADELPEPTSDDPDEWSIEIQKLSDCILWDADYEDDELYLDRAAEEARKPRREMDIEEEYFDAAMEDLTDEQAGVRSPSCGGDGGKIACSQGL